jgi:hypothetical protein
VAPSGQPGERFVDRAFRAAADAYVACPASWERATRSALAELLAFLARQPEQTETCVAISPGDHPAALVRRDEVVERFAALLRPGFGIPPQPPPSVVAEAIGGGILELIRIHVEERRVEELPDALPSATVLALTPFVGPERAEQLAAGERRVRASR